MEFRLKKQSQPFIDQILIEKDKGLINDEDFLERERKIIANCKSDLVQQDSRISYEVYMKLPSTKQATVERFLETIDKNVLIVWHNHRIKLITKGEWNSIVSEGTSGDYEIIYKCD